MEAHEYALPTHQVDCEAGRCHRAAQHEVEADHPSIVLIPLTKSDKQHLMNHETILDMENMFLRITGSLVSSDELHLPQCRIR